ncbi:MAG: FecR domain-containing protein [Elusimicrobia bacterium]|nr:FecR domain-containing protein [Elusimicrobiota bacterium]
MNTTRLPLFLFLAALSSILPSFAFAGAAIDDAVGSVQIRKSESSSWGSVSGAGHVVGKGDEIKTGRGSRTVVKFDDGSKVELGPNSAFALEEAENNQATMKFSLGFMKAWVTKALSRRFQVKTPTAVCSVRGTEFGVNVAEGGNTSVAVFSGLVGVGDTKGNEVLLSEGQKVDVTQAGITTKSEGSSEQGPEKTRQALKREVGLDMTKEEVQAAAANEIKSAVYQEGKAIIDVNGNRVRMEQYIIRPQPDQFKLVVLNERVDSFNYFYYTGTFNKNLPQDLSVALRQIQGQAINKPEYFLSSFETGRSNTTDSVVERATGGHLVDLNNNGDNTDNITSAFDPQVDGIVRLSVPNADAGAASGNDSFWSTLYQNYTLNFNGIAHTSWSPGGAAPAFVNANALAGITTGIRNYNGDIARVDVVTCKGPLCNNGTANQCVDADHCSMEPNPGKFQQNIYRENALGTVWDKFENYIISDEGKIANTSNFTGATSGPAFKSILLKWNYEQIITAGEFGGRKIDLAVSPRILIESGLIP